MADRPLIPEDVSRWVIDYVCGCTWCDYDSRTNPIHHPQCLRVRLLISNPPNEQASDG